MSSTPTSTSTTHDRDDTTDEERGHSPHDNTIDDGESNHSSRDHRLQQNLLFIMHEQARQLNAYLYGKSTQEFSRTIARKCLDRSLSDARAYLTKIIHFIMQLWLPAEQVHDSVLEYYGSWSEKVVDEKEIATLRQPFRELKEFLSDIECQLDVGLDKLADTYKNELLYCMMYI